MKNNPFLFLLFTLLVFLTSLTGCTQSQGLPHTDLPVNNTALAISIALNDSLVRESLTEPWTITGVNLNAKTTSVSDGKEVTIRTPNVMFDMESRVVNVYVDLGNQSVVNIYESPKRVPMPVKTQDNPST